MPKHIFAKEYEEYLITGKEEVLNSLPSGSIEKEYFILMKKLFKEDLTPKLQKQIDNFLKRIPEKQSYRLKAINIFKKLQKNPEKKTEIINDIKSLFQLENPKLHSKPVKYNKVSKNEKEENESQKLPNSLNLNKYLKANKFIEDVYSGAIIPNNTEFTKIYGYGSEDDKCIMDFNKIPEKTLVKIFNNEKDFTKINAFIWRSIPYAKLDYFKKVMKLTVDQCSKEEKTKESFRNNINNNLYFLLNEQINCLLEYKNVLDCDRLVSELIERKYSEISEDKKERVETLKEIKKLLNELNYKDDKMTRNVLSTILDLNSKMNIFELDTFIEYIQVPLHDNPSLYNINQDLRNKITNNNRQYRIFSCQIIEHNYDEDKKLIEKYLKHFYLKEKVAFEKFSKYFNENYIKKFYSKMQFYLGSEEPTKDNILSSNEVNDLMKETQLTICDFNKEVFNVKDDVELVLEIKNIQTLYVNIYEINTENYYYSNKKKFDNNITLDGIVPTYEDIFSYNDKPQFLIEKKISLNKLPKKRGLFVVEFIGNGHVSRAIIQKGNLKCIHKNTINGKVLYLLDEDNKICKGEKTGLWINNVWYPSIKDTGAILIPYSINGNIFVLKHEDFCCLETNVSIPSEKYDFNGQFIINEESFIMGNVTKVLVRPYLYVCDELCPLETLKNVKLTVNTVKTENNQDIPSVNVIDNIELSYNKEFSFDFQVPAKLNSVNFELSGDIKYKTRDETENLKFSKRYDFTRNFEFDTLFKKNSNGNYICHLLGKNGEPKINHQIDLGLEHKYEPNINNNGEQILMESDYEGKIDLGKLTDVEYVSLDKNTFKIEQSPKFTYLSSMTILENQEINLPFFEMNNNRIFLVKLSFRKYMENLTDKLKINITDKKNHLGNITLPKLAKGNYLLTINGHNIEIKVIKGKVIDIPDFIVTENGSIRYNNNLENSIAIENFSYENNELKIKLNKNNKSNNHPRVHINCVQYLPDKLNKNLMEFKESIFFSNKIKNQNVEFKYNKNKNEYLNNKILSDEMQYVLDRRQYEINLGNSLEKPSLLMKPQFIRDTTTEIKKGREGKNFELNQKYLEKRSENYERGRYQSGDKDRPKGIIIHDFINTSPYIKENLIPNENGEIIIKDINLKEYSFMHIICFDDISCNEDCFFLNNGVTSLRDLRAVNELDLSKNYCEFRKIYSLSKKDKHHINDITSIKYKIFDSLEKYIEFIKIVNPSLEKDIKDFDFLINFNNLNLSEKLDKITEYFSHETNIYLYFHHNDFFNKYIYPILKYKSEKTFIDYFLLENKEKINEFSEPQKIEELNTFEKCLLIYSIRKDNKELALSLARQIRSECPKENESELKRLFNIALNLKSIKEKEIEETIVETVNQAAFARAPEIMACRKVMSKPRIMFARKCAAPMAPRAAPMMMNLCAMPGKGMFNIEQGIADMINAKAQLFKEEGKSKEFCETQYYKKVYKNTISKSFIRPNHFFADLAKYWSENDSTRHIGFKSDNILIKQENLTQMIFILSVLDLEEKTMTQSQNLIKDQGLGLTIEANVNTYILTKEINETELNTDNKYALILAQMVSEANKSGKEEEKEPTKFLTNRTYEQQTIVTNISPDNITCEVLIQIPEGSIPVQSEEYKVIETAKISSYKSIVYRQKFYFPEEGTFKQYPASASINDLVIAKSGLKTYEVVSTIKLSKEEISSIDDVLNQGNKKEILEFIKKADIIKEEDLEKIYWMLKDKDFYKQLIDILKDKYIFDADIWEYSTNNEDIESLQEYIHNKNDKEILKSIGHEIDLTYLKLDKTNNAHILNHLDYYPILKNRIFKLPKSKSILTVQLRDTYQDYVSFLITLPKINDYEYMRLCYYLILQQRIKEATTIYEKIDKKNIVGNNLTSLELQYDYLTAYLDFSNGYPKFEKAREITKKYKDIAISNWKNMFNEIEDQLNEYDGKINFDEEITKEEKEQSKKEKHKAESEEILNIELKDQDINIIYKNISEFTVKYYLIDIEILFSRSPFVKKTKVDFNLVKPQKEDKIKVTNEQKENKYLLTIPEELRNKNFYIEISSGKKIENEIYNSSLLKYSIIESIGEIKVMTPELKPLSKVYVKCFCETNSGTIKFYKDGFTDLRGKFDYVSLNTDLVNEVKKFSILMVSKEYGSIIATCNPPKLIKETSGENSIEKMFDYRQQMRNKFKK